ncbi:hypothetical protein QUA81_24165 [Microcoleus sp. F6_B4]
MNSYLYLATPSNAEFLNSLVLIARTLAMRQGIHSLSDYRIVGLSDCRIVGLPI